jgi:hypothetical protein
LTFWEGYSLPINETNISHGELHLEIGFCEKQRPPGIDATRLPRKFAEFSGRFEDKTQ